MVKLIFQILACIYILQTSAVSSYSMKDLEYLENEKNYKEFLDHALDVLPSLRNSHWKNTVYNMAENYVKASSKTKNYNTELFSYFNKIALWPVLKNDEIFQINRANYSIKYFEHCFNNSKNLNEKNSCLNLLNNFWKDIGMVFVNLELGPKLAELLKQHYPNMGLWKYYSYLYKNQFATPFCKQKKVIDIFLQKWELDQIKTENTVEFTREIDNKISINCLKEFVPTLKEYMLDKSNSYKNSAYKLLEAKKFLSKIEQDLYLSTYILDEPKIGIIFNKSWVRIIELGRNFKRRKNVLKELKKLNPLPDKILFHKDKKTILKFFSKNFPEYFDHYAKTCLDYLKGSQIFKNGTPTLSCHELFRTSKKINLINKKYIDIYSDLL